MPKAKSAETKGASLTALAGIVGKHGDTLTSHARTLKDLAKRIDDVQSESQGNERKSKKASAVFREELQLWMRGIDSKVGDIERATASANVAVSQAVIELEKAAKRFDEAVLGLLGPVGEGE